jgi:intraflagellar transport protein 88
MHSEALNTYTMLVKKKEYEHAGRLRVNMGNIYYEQKKYQAAIKMYRMAMDQIGATSKKTRYKVEQYLSSPFFFCFPLIIIFR